MLGEETPELAPAQPEACRQALDIALVECAIRDEAEPARNDGRGPEPGGRPGRRLGATPAARAKAGRLGCRRAAKKAAVLELGRPYGADRSAVYTGGDHASEDPAVEPPVMTHERAVAAARIDVHVAKYSTGRTRPPATVGRDRPVGSRRSIGHCSSQPSGRGRASRSPPIRRTRDAGSQPIHISTTWQRAKRYITRPVYETRSPVGAMPMNSTLKVPSERKRRATLSACATTSSAVT